MPAWRLVDPLAILDAVDDDRGNCQEDEGLAEIIQRRGKPANQEEESPLAPSP